MTVRAGLDAECRWFRQWPVLTKLAAAISWAKPVVLMAAAVAIALFVYCPVLAASFTWNVDFGQFTDASDWTQNGIPIDSDGIPDGNDTTTFRRGAVPFATVIFWDGGVFNPTPIFPTVDRVIVGTNPLNFGGHSSSTLSVDSTNITETGRGLIIGQTGTDVAALNLAVSSLNTVYATIGSDAGSSGALNLNSATTGTFSVTGTSAAYDLIIGRFGAGAINLSNGRDTIVAGDTALGLYAGSTGNVSVAGSGSTWTSSGILHVGASGAGAFSVSSGGQIGNTDGYIGANPGSSGTVSINGNSSTWTSSGNLYVGNDGDGTLSIINGGKVLSSHGYIGAHAGSTGEALVSGSDNGFGARWDMSGNLYVGDLGDGALTISEGAVRNDTTYIGNAPGSVGRVSIDFGSLGSTADCYVGNQGMGTLAVLPSGSINTTGAALIGYVAGSSGAAVISDGDWRNSTVTVGYHGNGSLDVNSGGFMRTNSNVTIGSQLGSEGTVHLSGVNGSGIHSMWRVVSGSFYVGHQSTGLLEIADGGQLINEAGYGGSHAFDIGSAAGSEGVVTVSGAGSILSGFGQLTVGRATFGNLEISGGAVVDSGAGYIGRDSGSTGIVAVDGGGSLWESPGQFHVGYRGEGTMAITDGGLVRNYGDHGYVAYDTGSIGAVSVEGAGSKWTLEIGLHVGYGGAATLDITGGGLVESWQTAEIGGSGSTTGVGTVNVKGVGSHFDVGGDLDVGRRGSGKLNITEGALATIWVAEIGGSEFSSVAGEGAVTVDGSGSRLEISDGFIVGRSGVGTLAVTNGAYLQGNNIVIGEVSGGRGAVTIDGPGSHAFFEHSMRIGERGEGTFGIFNGAQVTTLTAADIGWTTGFPVGQGTATVDGAGSSWQLGSSLHVGFAGQGALQIRNGGQVTSQSGRIGRAVPQTTGVVTVDGPGSSWTNISNLTIEGNAGGAALHVTGGASVSNAQGFVGNTSGTNAEASVDGSGSQWINSGNLSVGGVGTGVLRVTNGATVQAPNLLIGANGKLHGDGDIVGNLQSAGVVSPGALNVDGNYTQTSTGELVIGLASHSSYDQLHVTGNISLAGTLRVPIEGFFAISVGDAFDILDFANLNGTFSTFDLPELPGFLTWDTSQLYTTGMLGVSSTLLEADFNEDGDVDGVDLTQWLGNFGNTLTNHAQGDADGDQDVDGADFVVWQRQLSSGVMVSASMPVPEPLTSALLPMGCAAIGVFRRREALLSSHFPDVCRIRPG